jgi:two-component system response regulator
MILPVEDDAPAALVLRLLEEAEVKKKNYPVREGKEALDYLFHRGKYAAKKSSPRPNLVLLDLRLPKLDGHDVLAAIKQSEELNVTPVVALTTSNNEKDITLAYRKYATSSLVEPLDSREFSEMIRELGSDWLVRNRYPENGVPIDKYIRSNQNVA